MHLQWLSWFAGMSQPAISGVIPLSDAACLQQLDATLTSFFSPLHDRLLRAPSAVLDAELERAAPPMTTELGLPVWCVCSIALHCACSCAWGAGC